jgi:hypothetical protein
MIKVKGKNGEKEITCDFCNGILLYNEDDIIDITEEWDGFFCPCCGNEIKIRERKKLIFPESFYQFGQTKSSAHLTNEEIQRMVDIVKDRTIKNGCYQIIATGDTIVFGTLDEDNYLTIYVAKNYYEDSIDLNK